MTSLIDCHCHIQDARFDSDRESVVQASPGYLLMAGVGPEDWKRQKLVHEKFPRCLPSYGLHPYWVSAHGEIECKMALLELEKWIPGGLALGECGLDYRSEIVGENRAHQRSYFVAQLDLAKKYKKVAVLHIVRAHQDALKILSEAKLQDGAVVHAFHGDKDRAKKYLKLGCYLSIGTMALDPRQTSLEGAIRAIPLDRMLVESDAPDQPPWNRRGERNHPGIVLDVVSRIAQIKGLEPLDVENQVTENIRCLFKDFP